MYAFNNKKDGFEKIFGTSVVESINYYLKCASLLRKHDPITGIKLVNMKLINWMQSTLGKRFELNKKFIDNEVGIGNLALNNGQDLLNDLENKLKDNPIMEFKTNRNSRMIEISELLKKDGYTPSAGFWLTKDDVLLISGLSMIRKRMKVIPWSGGPINFLVNRVGKSAAQIRSRCLKYYPGILETIYEDYKKGQFDFKQELIENSKKDNISFNNEYYIDLHNSYKTFL